MSPPDWLNQALVLREGGMTQTQISKELSIPQQRLSDWIRTKNLCLDCNELILERATRCLPCRRIKSKIWTQEAIILAIQEWAREHGEPPAMADWDSWRALHVLGDLERAERHKRETAEGRWPCFNTVVTAFGSWNKAIVAAGFEPRANSGGGGNGYRRRNSRAKRAKAMS